MPSLKDLGTEHGGMNEVLADVYAITGDAKYLKLAERFSHKLLLEPLSQSRDTLDGLHSNTQIPKVVGFQRIHVLTGEPSYSAATTCTSASNTKSGSRTCGSPCSPCWCHPSGRCLRAALPRFPASEADG